MNPSRDHRAHKSVKVRLLRDARFTFWTLTVWEHEAAMHSFMRSGAHLRAMPKLLDWCDEASVVHWHQETPELPAWREAHRRMLDEGRMSKVRHPSPAQQAKQIAEPRVSR